jgi:hypothetical protein
MLLQAKCPWEDEGNGGLWHAQTGLMEKGQTSGAASPSSASSGSCTAAATAAQRLAMQQPRPTASPCALGSNPLSPPAAEPVAVQAGCGRAWPGAGKGGSACAGSSISDLRVRVGQSAAAPGRARGRAAAPARGLASAAARSGRRWTRARPASAGSTAPARPAAAARLAGTPGRTCRSRTALLSPPVCPPRARVLTERERRAGRRRCALYKHQHASADTRVLLNSSLQTLPA